MTVGPQGAPSPLPPCGTTPGNLCPGRGPSPNHAGTLIRNFQNREKSIPVVDKPPSLWSLNGDQDNYYVPGSVLDVEVLW